MSISNNRSAWWATTPLPIAAQEKGDLKSDATYKAAAAK